MEERLKEEYDFIKKDLEGLQSNMLKSQENLYQRAALLNQACQSSDADS